MDDTKTPTTTKAERQRAYYLKHRDEIRAKTRAYYEANRERMGVKKREWAARNADKQLEASRKWVAVHREKRAEVVRSWQERNQQKRQAHIIVGNALQDRRLVRKPCEVCGAKAQAHHDDYSKPLDVRWLCTKHHGEVHRRIAA